MPRTHEYQLEPISGWRGLADAIVERAAKDYQLAWDRTKKSPYGDWEAESRIIELTAFFRSGWYALLTNVDPDWLIETIKRSCL